MLVLVVDSTLVETKTGTLPLLITAPHGGTTPLAGVQQRKRGTTVRDQHTKELALAVWERFKQIVGQAPFVVIAAFDRNHIDANRAEKFAYEHKDAAIHYRTYHAAIRAYIEQIRTKWQVGVLIDLHGQAEKPSVLHLGTRNGLCIGELIVRSSWDAYVGDNSLGGFLRRQGYSVHPATAPPIREHPHFNGGYTVQTYGSHQSGGLDAFQLEVGRNFRKQTEDYLTFAKDLAAALANFCNHYLPPRSVEAD